MRKELREINGELFGTPEAIELRKIGIYIKNQSGHHTFPYSWGFEIYKDKKYVYIFIGKESYSFILPRNRIPAETLDAFLLELKNRKGETP